MNIQHPVLIDLLKRSYSAEKAAAYAYQGHAAAVKDASEKKAIRQIELDEWHHREIVLEMMRAYGIAPSAYYELLFALIGRCISFSCHIIGWFMPFYFAGRLESGNVCEYFRVKQYFNQLGITRWDSALYDMGIKEKEHEVYFLQRIQASRLLPYFERLFSWGTGSGFNDVDLDDKYPLTESHRYCRDKKTPN